MIRTLVIAGSGMLGHKLCQILPEHDLEVVTTIRRGADFAAGYPGIFGHTRVVPGVDVLDERRLEAVLDEVAPQAVVNCAGIVKQLAAAQDPYLSVGVNAYLPHKLARQCARRNCRLIHISTDCVFAGTRGMYGENDPSDAEDLYGRSKYLGETTAAESAAITLRTSTIGRELEVPGHGLLEWFLAQNGKRVRGYARAIFSGLTTHELARVVARVITDHHRLHGLYQVAGRPISKFDLLGLIRSVYDLKVEIDRDETQVCDRSLRMDRFRDATGYAAPEWRDMIAAMHDDATPYADYHQGKELKPCS